MDEVRSMIRNFVESVKRVIVGNDETIDRLTEMFICGGHALSEDEPGTGKTLMAEAFATASGLDFNWVQGTPDLRPSDFTGVRVYNPETRQWEYHPGVVDTNVLVYDEINRASGKTQSALLEVMQNNRVTVDGETYPLPTPFMVLATQNPLEHDGVYPLPQAKIDRFPIRVTMEELTIEQETEVLIRTEIKEPSASSVPGFDIKRIRHQYERIHIEPRVLKYVARLMDAARHPEKHGVESEIRLGQSTRPGTWLVRMSKAAALKNGSVFVDAELIQERLFAVLNHRLHKGHKLLLSGKDLHEARDEFVPALIRSVPGPDVTKSDLEQLAHEERAKRATTE